MINKNWRGGTWSGGLFVFERDVCGVMSPSFFLSFFLTHLNKMMSQNKIKKKKKNRYQHLRESRGRTGGRVG